MNFPWIFCTRFDSILSFSQYYFWFFHNVVFSLPLFLHFASLSFRYQIIRSIFCLMYDSHCNWIVLIEDTHTGTLTHRHSHSRAHTHLLLSFRFLQSCRWIFFLIVIINRSSSSSFEMEGRKSCHMHDKRIRQITLKYKRQMNEKSWMYLSRRKKKIGNECVRECVHEFLHFHNIGAGEWEKFINKWVDMILFSLRLRLISYQFDTYRQCRIYS